jgi:hypothetical protein
MKQKHRKQKREWQPYKDFRVGDRTDLGVITAVEIERKLESATSIMLDRETCFTTANKSLCASCVEQNYTRMRRQIEILRTASERAPSRKTAIRDLSRFLNSGTPESKFTSKTFLDDLDNMLSRHEQAVKVEKIARKFGI